MNRSRLNRWLAGLFMVGSLVGLLAFNLSKPRVVVVFTGDAQSISTQLMDKGMQQVLTANRMPVTVERQYLAVNQDDASPAALRQAQSQAAQMIRLRKPTLVVLVDDEANVLLGSALGPQGRGAGGSAGARIVYVSLNSDPASLGYVGNPRVTGLSEHLPLASVGRLIADLGRTQGQRVGVIGMSSATGSALAQQIRQAQWAPHRLVAEHFVEDETQWRAAVQAMRGQVDVLLVAGMAILNLQNSQAGQPAMSTEALKSLVVWTEAESKALTIGLTATYAELGGSLGVTPSREEQGAAAMTMALQWLDPRRTDQGPPQPEVQKHFEVHVRQAALKKLGVDLPPIYLEAARAAGHLRP